MSTVLSVRTEEDTIEKLDQIAGVIDRNRNWIVNEAIKGYLEAYEWQLDHIRKGIADSDGGRTLTGEQVRTRILKRHTSTKAKPQR